MGEHFSGSQETLSYLEGFPYLDLASPTYKMRKWRWNSWVSVVKGDVLWGLFRALSNPLSTYETAQLSLRTSCTSVITTTKNSQGEAFLCSNRDLLFPAVSGL